MKAVVLETRGRRAAVLVKDGSVRVVHGSYSVGEIIEYGEAARPSARQWIAAGVAMVMLIGASAGLWVDRNFTAYAEVSLDVNPSMVFTVNKRDRVLGVRAANADAEDIVAQLQQEDIRFSTVSDAVEKALALMDDEGYLDESAEDYVLINVSADDDARQERLSEAVETAMEHTQTRDATLEYRIDCSDRDTAKAAKRSGMSAGRYAAWQQDSGDTSEDAPTLEEYAHKPVRELLGHKDAERDDHDAPSGSKHEASPSDTPGDVKTEDAPREARPDAQPKDEQPPEAGVPEVDASDDSASPPDGSVSREAKEMPEDNDSSSPQDKPALDEASMPQAMPQVDDIPATQDKSAVDESPASRETPAGKTQEPDGKPSGEAQSAPDRPSADAASDSKDKPAADAASDSKDKPAADAASDSKDKPADNARKSSDKPSGDGAKSRSDTKRDKTPSDNKSAPSPSGGKPGGGNDPGPH